jgi:hypothetical protein
MVANPRIHLPVVDEARFRRPRTVGDCRKGIRPCPWVGCRMNLLIDVLPDGGLLLNAAYVSAKTGAERVIPAKREADERANDEIHDFVEAVFDEPIPPVKSCVIDEAMSRLKDGAQLEEIADVLFVSRERARQIESGAILELLEEFTIRGYDRATVEELEDILDRGGR